MLPVPPNIPHRGTPPPDFAALMGKSATLSRGPPNPYDLSNLLIMGRARGATPTGVPPLKLPETLKDMEEDPPHTFLSDLNNKRNEHTLTGEGVSGTIAVSAFVIGLLLVAIFGRR